MSFEFSDGESTVRQIYSCTECIYVSTARHFDDGDCPLCGSPARKSGMQRSQSGVSAMKYRMLLDHIEEHASGVGAATVSNIEEAFDGDEFLDVAEDAYQNADYDALTDVSGVGESTAESIALAVADEEGWEGGLAESRFSF